MTEPWIQNAIDTVKQVDFPEYEFNVLVSETTKAVYLQDSYFEKDTVTGKLERQVTRRWLLSPEQSKSEIVFTAFKCVMTSMEHKTREWFLYRGRAIMHPHQDVDTLYRICQDRDHREV